MISNMAGKQIREREEYGKKGRGWSSGPSRAKLMWAERGNEETREEVK